MPISDKPIDETKGQISDRVIDRIVDCYGFDDSWSILPIIPMNGTLVVLNSFSETTKKAVLSHKSERYILKEVPWYCSKRDFVEFMLSFQEHMHDVGFQVPKIIRSTGDSPFVEVGGRFYYMQCFINGMAYGGVNAQIVEAGENLGRLHSISQSYSSSLSKERKDRFAETPFRLARSMVSVLERLVGKNDDRLEREEKQVIADYCKDARLWLNNLEKIASDSIRQQIQVHGDYNPLNLLYDKEERVISTFDMENTAIDDPTHDIAEGLLDFSFNTYKPHSTRFSGLEEHIDAKRAKHFLTGYHASDPKRYRKIHKNIPPVLGAVFVELVTLGLVRGDYEFHLAIPAIKIGKQVVKEVAEIR